MAMYDVIVVGARCAGSPTAMLLARKGYRVLLVDRATFPSDTISTHIVWQTGTAQLKRWGVLEKVTESGCPPIRQMTIDFGEVTLVGSPPPLEGVAEAYAPRRTVLDKILVDAAAEAGVEVREGFAVTEIVMDGDRVTGIRGRGRGGTEVAEEARLVIGADGLHSIVARAVQAPEYDVQPTLACWYYAYWSGVPIDGVTFCARDGRAIGLMPTNDGLVCVPVAVAARDFESFRADFETNYLATIELAPRIAERVRAGRREEHLRAMSDVPNLFRRPYGPGWALVGDAGYHKDPINAQGISDAFRHAELLVEAVADGFGGRRPLEEALAEYERRRNEAVRPMYEFNCQLAALDPPPPEMQAVFAALRQNQEETNRFVGTIAGTVPIPEFFAPENLGRIVSGR
jgi:flavin-dependent dehydrogenase